MYSYNPDRSCVFKVDFRDGMRAITNNYYVKNITKTGEPIFKDGYMSAINGQNLTFKIDTPKTLAHSIRVVLSFDALNDGYADYFLGSFKGGIVCGGLQRNTSNVIESFFGELYINGVLYTGYPLETNVKYDIVVRNNLNRWLYTDQYQGDTFGINTQTSISSFTPIKFYTVERYNRNLSIVEIKNLYEGKTFVPFEDASEVVRLWSKNGILQNSLGIVVNNIGAEKDYFYNTNLSYYSSSLSNDNQTRTRVAIIQRNTSLATSLFFPENTPNIRYYMFVSAIGLTYLIQDSEFRYIGKLEIGKYNVIGHSFNKLTSKHKLYFNGIKVGEFNQIKQVVDTTINRTHLTYTSTKDLLFKEIREFARELTDSEHTQIYTSEKKQFNL